MHLWLLILSEFSVITVIDGYSKLDDYDLPDVHWLRLYNGVGSNTASGLQNGEFLDNAIQDGKYINRKHGSPVRSIIYFSRGKGGNNVSKRLWHRRDVSREDRDQYERHLSDYIQLTASK